MQFFLPNLPQICLIQYDTLPNKMLKDCSVFLYQKSTLVTRPFHHLLEGIIKNSFKIFIVRVFKLRDLYTALPRVCLPTYTIWPVEIKGVVQSIEEKLVMYMFSFQGEFIIWVVLANLINFFSGG